MKILFITLSNIGDCFLTLPVLDAIAKKYPQAQITCLVPQRPAEIFLHNPVVKDVVVFDKHSRLREKIKLFFSLNKEKFDLVVDLRNSFFGAFLNAKKRTSPFKIIPDRIKHMRNRHLFRAGLEDPAIDGHQEALKITSADDDYIEKILKDAGLHKKDFIVLAPGARSRTKCWEKEKFAQLSQMLIQEGYALVLVGDKTDAPRCAYLQKPSWPVLNLCARTTIRQLAALLKRSKLLVTNDSAVMHLASYLDTPTVAVFGPTDEFKYGPWTQQSAIAKKEVFCRPCQKAVCRFGTLACLAYIKPQEVFKQVKLVLADEKIKQNALDQRYRRILISRTDRLGDLLLSTPVIKALRDRFPQAYLAILVAPLAKEIVQGNPYLDEVIVYDKDGKDKSWLRTLKFARNLAQRKFDLAIVLHPSNRLHLLTFLAGIRQRFGYNRKLGFLLTHRKVHLKQEGMRHEAEYNFDLLADLEVNANPGDLFMPLLPESERYVEALLSQNGFTQKDKILVIHPGASCPSKIWPPERFAKLTEKLVNLYHFKTIIVGGPQEIRLADKIITEYQGPGKILNLAGQSSISQLASLLKRCTLFISNDSGPVHIASALEVPVISIFGRKQPGLGPKRWGPLGKRSRYLHKDVGCVQCLAHNCQKDFACLKAITIDDLVAAAASILE